MIDVETQSLTLNPIPTSNQEQTNYVQNQKDRDISNSRSKKLEDAVKALNAEYAMTQQTEKTKYQPEKILIKFPDPLLNNDIVMGYSNSIEAVKFSKVYEPRVCEIILKVGEDPNYVIQELKKIPFGEDYLDAERIVSYVENKQTMKPEEIDPYTLFLGNLPTKLSIKDIQSIFPNAKSYDMGYVAKTKFTKYVFICYPNVEEALIAYKKNYNLILSNRKILLRFRRCRNGIITDKPDQSDGDDYKICGNKSNESILELNNPSQNSNSNSFPLDPIQTNQFEDYHQIIDNDSSIIKQEIFQIESDKEKNIEEDIDFL